MKKLKVAVKPGAQPVEMEKLKSIGSHPGVGYVAVVEWPGRGPVTVYGRGTYRQYVPMFIPPQARR